MSDHADRLILDIGNTRVHWRLGVQSGDAVVAELLSGEPLSDTIRPSTVGTVVCARVGDARVEALLRSQFDRAHWSTVSRVDWLEGRTNYDLNQLGVDRALALLGAVTQYPELESRGVVVVDAGTAVTLDVYVEGHHQGGWIMPGYRRWHDALYGGTQMPHGLTESLRPGLGSSTPEAIGYAWLQSVLALIDQACRRAPGCGLVLTGGDAHRLTAHCGGDALQVSDLVLTGIEAWSSIR